MVLCVKKETRMGIRGRFGFVLEWRFSFSMSCLKYKACAAQLAVAIQGLLKKDDSRIYQNKEKEEMGDENLELMLFSEQQECLA